MTTPAQHRILLGITGGVAAYKAAELCRLLVRDGVDVRVVMTQAACRFVTPVTMQALSGQPVLTDLWDASIPNAMGHIELSRDRDLVVVAPASADFLCKLAGGLAELPAVGETLRLLTLSAFDGIAGIIAGALVLGMVTGVRRVLRPRAEAVPISSGSPR